MATKVDEMAQAIRRAATEWRGGPDEEYYRRLAEAAIDVLIVNEQCDHIWREERIGEWVCMRCDLRE